MRSKIDRFEELIAWQKARVLVADIYGATARDQFNSDPMLKNQMRRAAVSILSNIAEGFERGRISEFHQFLSIAKGSCAELRSQLYVALDAKFLNESHFARLQNQAAEVGRILGGLRSAIQRKRDLQQA